MAHSNHFKLLPIFELMINYFWKMRKKLADSNQFFRYSRYAIGEIVLVVIGILIALSINNWNEDRKNYKKEVANLNSLKSEMITSLKELKNDYEELLISYESTINIHQYIQTKPQLVDSMYVDFHNSVKFNYFFPKVSTYETLKSGNLELIKSDSLRMLITDVYESGYQRILTKVNTRRNAARVLFPYYQKHFRTKTGVIADSLLSVDTNRLDFTKIGTLISENYFGIPNDYEFLVNDPEYETLISEAIAGRYMGIIDIKKTINSVENCISQIDIYLHE